MNDILCSLRLVLASVLICCIGYPIALLGIGRGLFGDQAEGSLVRDDTGSIRGSRLIAQAFTAPEYVWPRPSACSYDASATGGSNLSSASVALRDRAAATVEAYAPAAGDQLPADLVAASGSGMDPHVTRSAARYQARRVAAARGVDESRVLELIEAGLESGPFALLVGGEPLVNVLLLNRELDRECPKRVQ